MGQSKMKAGFLGLFLAVGLLMTPSPRVAVADAGASCECPKLECGPCAQEQGLTFYSEKCGASNSQVKSCARPTCVPLENPPTSCSKARTPQSLKSETAQIAAPVTRGAVIGEVKVVEGTAWLMLPDGSKLSVVQGTPVHEGDSLKTEKNSKVNLKFKDGNLAQVQNDTMVKISEYEMKEDKRKAVIDLLRGQLRNQVKQKYNGTTSSYQVKTKTAVAGVRGTDFIVTYQEGDKVETQISTLKGKVLLANNDYSQSLELGAGEQGSYVVDANEVFAKEELSEFVARGYMTPIYRLTAKEIDQLMKRTANPVQNRQTAAVKTLICSSPKAELNQCAWTCVNNPKGENICRTDLADVHCQRRRCNANGEWSEETRLPASFQEQCRPTGVKVGPCDY